MGSASQQVQLNRSVFVLATTVGFLPPPPRPRGCRVYSSLHGMPRVLLTYTQTHTHKWTCRGRVQHPSNRLPPVFLFYYTYVPTHTTTACALNDNFFWYYWVCACSARIGLRSERLYALYAPCGIIVHRFFFFFLPCAALDFLLLFPTTHKRRCNSTNTKQFNYPDSRPKKKKQSIFNATNRN